MTNDFSAGVIPFLKNGNEIKYLIIKQRSGHWGFPKGHPIGEETHQETALRELHEETNLNGSIIPDSPIYKQIYSFNADESQIHKEVILFLCLLEGSDVNILRDEVEDYKFAEYENAYILLTYPEAQENLKEANDFLLNRL